MTRIQFQTELDIHQLINQLSISELETFSKAINHAIEQKKLQEQEQKEKVLLKELNTNCVLPTNSWDRFQKLVNLREQGNISDDERQELEQLILEEEKLRLKRIEVLGELSKLKNVPLATLMQEMDIQYN